MKVILAKKNRHFNAHIVTTSRGALKTSKRWGYVLNDLKAEVNFKDTGAREKLGTQSNSSLIDSRKRYSTKQFFEGCNKFIRK